MTIAELDQAICAAREGDKDAEEKLRAVVHASIDRMDLETAQGTLHSLICAAKIESVIALLIACTDGENQP